MAYRFAVLLAVFAAVSAVPYKSLLKLLNHDFVDYYDCSGKANGNYLHPFDCTRYITCSNGKAADMACPDCGPNNIAQCAGYDNLIYDQTANECLRPFDTACQVEHQPRNHPGTTQHPKTTHHQETTDHPKTTHHPRSSEETSSSEESSEETTTTGTETPSPVNCQGLKVGDSCDKDDCEKCGYCVKKMSFYFRCERIVPPDPKQNVTGVIVLEACDENLWWNPANKPDAVREGGVCDKWVNLSETVKNAYTSDESCVPPAPLLL